jgi:hypothetical protein
MNVEIGTKAVQFLFWEHLFRIFVIVSLQCMHCIPAEDLLPQRNLKGSLDEDKAYLTLKKSVHNSRIVG